MPLPNRWVLAFWEGDAREDVEPNCCLVWLERPLRGGDPLFQAVWRDGYGDECSVPFLWQALPRG
jgi:hypothetical protein